MSDISIRIPGGQSKRLLTGGKYCPDNIVVTAEGGGVLPPVEEKDVNFYDYDGTLLYSYTLAEAQALTELPKAPTPKRDFLEFQEWNWTLEDLKEYGLAQDVAALYVTEDGATRYELVNDFGRNVNVTFAWKQYAAHGATMDFGDGSEPYSTDKTGDVSVTHSYAPGTYIAKLSGGCNLAGTSTSSGVNDLLGFGSALLKKAYVGDVNYIYGNTFRNCNRLESVSIHRNCVIVSANAFHGCRNLAFAALENRHDYTGMSSGVFSDCKRLNIISVSKGFQVLHGLNNNAVKRMCLPNTIGTIVGNFADNVAMLYCNIPKGITALPNNAFLRCYSLLTLEIPELVTSIGANAFNSCTSIRMLKFLPTTPPAVSNANAFADFPTDCVVEVPAASLDAYKNATNYGSIAAQMVGV